MSGNPSHPQSAMIFAPIAALAVLSAVAIAWVEAPMLAAALGSVSAMSATLAAWRGVTILGRRAEPVHTSALSENRADHRRPTIDRESGLLAEWYFRLRAEEEIARARRYGQPLTLLTVSVPSQQQSDAVVGAVRDQLREVDFAGDLGRWIVVCLPSTPRGGAETVRTRLAPQLPDVEIVLTEYAQDGDTLSELLREETWDFSHPLSEFGIGATDAA